MKFKDLTIKDKVLVAIGDLYDNDNDVEVSSVNDIRMHLAETFEEYYTNKQISNALHSLRIDGYVNPIYCNGRICLTRHGCHRYASICNNALNADDEPSCPQTYITSNDQTAIAQKFADEAKRLADIANANVSSLQKTNSLEDENASLRSTVTKLREQLALVYADVDAKNKKIEHLEDSLDKLAENFNTMRNWALSMKNGAN